MKTVLIAFLAGLLLFGCAGYGASPQPGPSPAVGAKFSDSQYASTAVQVYPDSSAGPSSAEVQGFDMATSPGADGSVLITMTEKVGGQKLSATVPAGGSLYFNDANPGDDAAGSDKFLQDDELIIVDKNGNIVQ